MVGSVESKKGKGFALVIGGILLAVDAFGLDLAMSPDLAIGLPYALVVVPGLWWTDRGYIITAAVVGSLLCLLGFYFTFSSDPLWMGVANRGIALFVIWTVAVLCLFQKKVTLEKLELQRRNDHIGQERFVMENALKETRNKFQDMEKDTALLRLKVLEKEARFDQIEEEFFKVEKTLKEQESRLIALVEGQGKGVEEFERLQESLNRLQQEKMNMEERLADKDGQIEKAEEDRNRTAGALWEKEQRLADVLDDLSLLEKDLRKKTESLGRMEEELEEKDRLFRRLESKMLAVEDQLQLAQRTLRDRERLLEKIEKQIHETRKGNAEAGPPRELDKVALEQKEKQRKQMEWGLARRQQRSLKNSDSRVGRTAPDVDFERTPEEQNGKNQPLEREPDDENVKTKFRQYTRELERSNEDLREFAAVASHDLQEPIRKIIGFGMRLKKDCSPYLDDRGKDYLERMERSARQMQKFVDDLLQYSKVTASSNRRQQVDLKETISHVLTVLESRIEQTHPILEVGSMPVVEADRMQMSQLFQNLISNAFKFHKKGEPPVVRINHRILENGCHEIRVEDQGIGFDEKHRDRIFKPFERLHGKSEYEGTGMGLAICQKIVHRHGGELTAQSSPQEGTAFIVTLPAQRGEEKPAPQEG